MKILLYQSATENSSSSKGTKKKGLIFKESQSNSEKSKYCNTEGISACHA